MSTTDVINVTLTVQESVVILDGLRTLEVDEIVDKLKEKIIDKVKVLEKTNETNLLQRL